MTLPLPTPDTIQAGADALEKAGRNDRTLFIAVMVALLLFVGYITWNSSSSMKEQRDAFIQQMERRDDKTINAINKMSDALNKNSEVMIELKTRIK